jgi:hypothetical protein
VAGGQDVRVDQREVDPVVAEVKIADHVAGDARGIGEAAVDEDVLAEA